MAIEFPKGALRGFDDFLKERGMGPDFVLGYALEDIPKDKKGQIQLTPEAWELLIEFLSRGSKE